MRVLLILLLVVGLVPAAEPSREADLHQQLRDLKAPWYDAGRDDWRRIELPEARERRTEEPTTTHGDGHWSVGPVAWLLLLVVLVVVVLLILDLVQAWRRGAVGVEDAAGPQRPALRPVDLSHLPFHVDESADPEREAEAAFAAGDWNRAVVWNYVVQLVACDHAGLIRLGPGATDRGCLRQARESAREGRPSAGGEVLAATLAVFERAYFGHVPATSEEASAVRAGTRHLRDALVAEGRR